jgi:hypothetical protein
VSLRSSDKTVFQVLNDSQHASKLAEWLLGSAALSTIIISIGVDAVLLAKGLIVI